MHGASARTVVTGPSVPTWLHGTGLPVPPARAGSPALSALDVLTSGVARGPTSGTSIGATRGASVRITVARSGGTALRTLIRLSPSSSH